MEIYEIFAYRYFSNLSRIREQILLGSSIFKGSSNRFRKSRSNTEEIQQFNPQDRTVITDHVLTYLKKIITVLEPSPKD